MSGEAKDETKMSEDLKKEDTDTEPKDVAVEDKNEESQVSSPQDGADVEPTKDSTAETTVAPAATEKRNNEDSKSEDDDMKTEENKATAEIKVEGDGKILKDLDDEAPKTFPQILMDILGNEEESDTIAWLPHGRSFIIYKKKTFAQLVLPRYFKATKFTSFTRKLNRWGFTRVTRGPEMGSYYHKLFLRDEPGLCLRMSSHSSSKFQEQQQLMPNPMGGMAFGGIPFAVPGMMPGMMNPMNMNPADLNQQNQLIQQQLQQLQWQQFQLQQLQQQHQQAQSGMNGVAQQAHHPSQPPHHLSQGHPQHGHPQQGHPQQGHPQQGHPQQGHPQQGQLQGHQQPGPSMMHGPPPHPHGPGGPALPHAPGVHGSTSPHTPNPHATGGHIPPGPHPHHSNGHAPTHANSGVPPPHHQVQSPQQQQGGGTLQQQRPPQMMVHSNQNVQSSPGRDEIVTM